MSRYHSGQSGAFDANEEIVRASLKIPLMPWLCFRREYLNRFCCLQLALLLLSLSTFTAPMALSQTTSRMESPASQPFHDGQHDFDFHFGTWETHIKRLVHPLSGSSTWVEMDGTVTVRRVWGGQANLEELDASNDTVRFRGLTLFLYNPASHQWSQTFVNINEGSLSSPPLIGGFKDGRGEFYSQDRFNGRSIFVRFMWSQVTPDSHHVEQSFSIDGGKTWEPNFVANLVRVKK
jgi:hypothetical protein